jgi:putative DNA primase/helicase
MRSNDKRQSNLEAALEYARQGYAVLPLKGKLPLTTHGYKDASRDVAQIAKWWGKHPNANIGIATGEPSGLLVLDIDNKNGKDGDKSLRELEKQYGPLPKTLKAKTPSGGWHYVFRMPAVVLRMPARGAM